ncbi:MAG: Ezrin/radixin/moesin family protein [Cytophagaceae bacterium]|nr:Ezrin/radixin/moesin family protein [Cytophagaceae bacterium]
MRKVVFLFLAMSLSLSVSFAQKLTKEEKAEEKEWAKKMKNLKPLDYKHLIEEKESLSLQAQEASSNLNQCTSSQAAKDEEIVKLRAQLDSLRSAAPAAAVLAKAGKKTNSVTASTAKPGVIYKVQIGAFRNKDLTKYFNNNKNFSGDVDADGAKKYTLGEFVEYWEADNFKKYLREMGVKDAWIVAYKDGNRVPIKDALEGTL